jgi:hypothetical protein
MKEKIQGFVDQLKKNQRHYSCIIESANEYLSEEDKYIHLQLLKYSIKLKDVESYIAELSGILKEEEEKENKCITPCEYEGRCSSVIRYQCLVCIPKDAIKEQKEEPKKETRFCFECRRSERIKSSVGEYYKCRIDFEVVPTIKANDCPHYKNRKDID